MVREQEDNQDEDKVVKSQYDSEIKRVPESTESGPAALPTHTSSTAHVTSKAMTIVDIAYPNYKIHSTGMS